MSNDVGENRKFSIFDQSIRCEHREFYEEIVNEVDVIIPICVQGETIAVAISENQKEQSQITELMKRVEEFARQLLQVTKKLFDQYYIAKQEQHESILHNTAYIKINTLDRNLLERTCDVRWWALEMAFSDCIAFYDETSRKAAAVWEMLENSRGVPEVSDEDDSDVMDAPFQGINQDEHFRIIDELTNFSGLLKYGALCNFSDRFKGFCYDYRGSAENKRELEAFQRDLVELDSRITFACYRLEDINNSYTLYRDLVITDSEGYIIANSNAGKRAAVLGLCVESEEWFEKALQTADGTEYFAQDITSSVVEEQLSLVYSTAVRENSDENGAVIGAMGVYFDFQGESKIILDEYMPLDEDGIIQDGCYSLFTSSDAKIIGSTDEDIIEVGSHAHIPRKNRALQDGERVNTYMAFEGIDSVIFSSRTDGYLEYRGLGWSAHVILPKSHIFESDAGTDNDNINLKELMDSNINPLINKQTYRQIQKDKKQILLISLNGILFASKLGKRGGQLAPIFHQITQSSNAVTSKMEQLLEEMAFGELQLNLKTLENFAKQGIDLIDRNLFERSADIRWWSTDEYFWKALSNPSESEFVKASNRLKVINGSYTMYRNLVLADSQGVIRACSDTDLMHDLADINVSDHIWFIKGKETRQSNQYAVQDAMDSALETDKERSLIYSGGVRRNGERQGEAIGVLGIVFDWDTEAKKILATCLPKNRRGEVFPGSVAVYLNKDFEVIETTGAGDFAVGSLITLPDDVASLAAGEQISGLFEFKGQKYIYGACLTKGYREYPGLGWLAVVLRPFITK